MAENGEEKSQEWKLHLRPPSVPSHSKLQSPPSWDSIRHDDATSASNTSSESDHHGHQNGELSTNVVNQSSKRSQHQSLIVAICACGIKKRTEEKKEMSKAYQTCINLFASLSSSASVFDLPSAMILLQSLSASSNSDFLLCWTESDIAERGSMISEVRNCGVKFEDFLQKLQNGMKKQMRWNKRLEKMVIQNLPAEWR